MTCLVLLAVGAVFCMMAVYIKLTHFTGYRQHAGQHASTGWWGSIGGGWGGMSASEAALRAAIAREDESLAVGGGAPLHEEL